MKRKTVGTPVAVVCRRRRRRPSRLERGAVRVVPRDAAAVREVSASRAVAIGRVAVIVVLIYARGRHAGAGHALLARRGVAVRHGHRIDTRAAGVLPGESSRVSDHDDVISVGVQMCRHKLDRLDRPRVPSVKRGPVREPHRSSQLSLLRVV